MRSLRILLPPGIGDAHWVLLKLESFLRQKGAHEAQVWSMCPEQNRRRSLDLLKRVPFIRAMGEFVVSPEKLKETLPQGINDEPSDVIGGAFGFDYYICFNKSLRDGGYMEGILPGVSVNWSYEISETEEDRVWADGFQVGVGRYAIFYFSDYGMHQRWAAHFSPGRAQELLKAFRLTSPGITPVLIGMNPFDARFNGAISHLAYSVVGKTTTAQMLALIRRADCMVGFHNGPTLISPHLGTPTVMLWSREHFKCGTFRTNWVDPAKIGSLYRYHDVESVGVGRILDDVQSIRRK